MMDVVDEPITANSVLPARREPLSLMTADGLQLVGEVALPLDHQPRRRSCVSIRCPRTAA